MDEPRGIAELVAAAEAAGHPTLSAYVTDLEVWRDRLRRYIRHVGACEGTDYVDNYLDAEFIEDGWYRADVAAIDAAGWPYDRHDGCPFL